MKVWYSATVFTALLAFVMALPGGQLDDEFMDYVLQRYMESKMLCKTVPIHHFAYTCDVIISM